MFSSSSHSVKFCVVSMSKSHENPCEALNRSASFLSSLIRSWSASVRCLCSVVVVTCGADTSGLTPCLWNLNWIRFFGSSGVMVVYPMVLSFCVCFDMMVFWRCFVMMWVLSCMSVLYSVVIQKFLHVNVYVVGALSAALITRCWCSVCMSM